MNAQRARDITYKVLAERAEEAVDCAHVDVLPGVLLEIEDAAHRGKDSCIIKVRLPHSKLHLRTDKVRDALALELGRRDFGCEPISGKSELLVSW